MKVAILDRERFDPGEVFQFIHRERVTWLPLVPTLLVELVETPYLDRYLSQYDVDSLRLIVTAGAPLPFHIAEKAERVFGAKVVNHLGTSDSMALSASPLEAPPEARWGTAGKISGDGEIKFVDDAGNDVPKGEVGEIWFRGSAVVAAYFNNEEATKETWTEDGWFQSGDLGKLDKDGNLLVVGRKKDMIIRGGQNIFPGEIEELLLTHPKVADVALVGMPDILMGERICAFIETIDGMDCTLEDITDFLKEKKIAMFKIPERVECVKTLPRIPETKKADKKQMRKMIAEKLNT